jgi:hypothetical protein
VQIKIWSRSPRNLDARTDGRTDRQLKCDLTYRSTSPLSCQYKIFIIGRRVRHQYLPTGRPDAPRTCMMVNRTSTTVQVNCEKGFDGGLPQEFTMELYSAAHSGGHRRIISNITSRSKPEFTVTGLEPGAGYFVSVYSSNGKGRSSTFTLSVSTLKSTHQEHRRTTGGCNSCGTSIVMWAALGSLSLIEIQFMMVLSL